MQTMPNQIIDQHGPAAHAHTLAHKLRQLLRLQMVREKAATHQIECAIPERQGKPVGHNAVAFWPRISSGAISRTMIS